MKTAELSGAALDWAVTHANYEINGAHIWNTENCNYSTDWALGGAIIEREGLGIWKYQWNEQGEPEVGWYAEDKNGDHVRTGATPLEAAMRCYVASKLGDDVEIPEGL